jgi:hypothetical protein
MPKSWQQPLSTLTYWIRWWTWSTITRSDLDCHVCVCLYVCVCAWTVVQLLSTLFCRGPCTWDYTVRALYVVGNLGAKDVRCWDKIHRLALLEQGLRPIYHLRWQQKHWLPALAAWIASTVLQCAQWAWIARAILQCAQWAWIASTVSQCALWAWIARAVLQCALWAWIARAVLQCAQWASGTLCSVCVCSVCVCGCSDSVVCLLRARFVFCQGSLPLTHTFSLCVCGTACCVGGGRGGCFGMDFWCRCMLRYIGCVFVCVYLRVHVCMRVYLVSDLVRCKGLPAFWKDLSHSPSPWFYDACTAAIAHFSQVTLQTALYEGWLDWWLMLECVPCKTAAA